MDFIKVCLGYDAVVGVRCVIGKDFTVIFGALKGQVIGCITLLVEGASSIFFVFKDTFDGGMMPMLIDIGMKPV